MRSYYDQGGYGEGFEERGPQIRFGFGGATWTPAVKSIVIATAAVYLLQMLLRPRGAEYVLAPLILSSPDLLKGKVWQLVTYMFIHGSFWHVGFNMLGLWMFGREVERSLGTRKFLALYFFAGIFAGLANCLFDPGSSVVGASGSVYGAVAAFGALFPKRMVFLLFIPMYARTMVILFVVLSLFGSGGPNIAHFAHLGGLAFGYLFIGTRRRWEPFVENLSPRPYESDDEVTVEDEVEMDRLLSKVKNEGLHCLSWREKRFLDKISERLRNR